MMSSCPFTTTLQLIGGKWKSLILWNLRYGLQRFGELRRAIPGVTQKMLTQQLRELEQDGMISRQVFAEIPPRVEYTLTPLGRSLLPILEAMSAWGQTYGSRDNPIDVEREAIEKNGPVARKSDENN